MFPFKPNIEKKKPFESSSCSPESQSAGLGASSEGSFSSTCFISSLNSSLD